MNDYEIWIICSFIQANAFLFFSTSFSYAKPSRFAVSGYNSSISQWSYVGTAIRVDIEDMVYSLYAFPHMESYYEAYRIDILCM